MLRRYILRILLLVTILSSLLAAIRVQPASAVEGAGAGNADQALCLPGADLLETNNCLQAGPAARLQELAALGISLPPRPIIAGRTPRDLAVIPFQYGVVTKDENLLYDSLDEVAKDNSTSVLPSGRIKYVSLKEAAETNRGRYYKIATGKWISAEYVRKVGVQNFQGFVFKKTPDFIFGWVINEAPAYPTPGFTQPKTGRIYNRFQVVHVYDSAVVDGNEWVMVDLGQWIEHRNMARVIPNTIKPDGVNAERWIEVNLYEQVISVYENGSLLFSTLISSGVDPFFTKPGVFQIYKKLEHDPMSGTFEQDRSDYYYLEDVPYILYYDELRALHGAYWHSMLGYQLSHGCVNLSIADAHWLYNWANVGDYVYVVDPSGKTPTDPALYGEGGV